MYPKDTVLVTIVITVDTQHTADFNRGNLDFAGVLLFRVTHGKDIYVSTSGKWDLSCFGESPDLLCRLTKPIKNYKITEFLELVSKIDNTKVPAIKDCHIETSNIPLPELEISPISKEVWQLVNFIYKYGLVLDNILKLKSDPIICQHFRDCLVSGRQFNLEQLMGDFVTSTGEYPTINLKDVQTMNSSTLEPTYLSRGASVAVASALETLVLLLKSGKGPIVPHIIQEQICLPEIPKEPLKNMPTANKNLFQFIVAFLKQFKTNYGGIPSLSEADLGIYN